MRNLNMLLSLLLITNAFPTAAAAQSAREMDLQDFTYVAQSSGAKWEVTMDDTSKYSASGVPETRSGTVTITSKQKSKADKVKKIQIADFPNEDGFFILSLQGMEEPLFLLVSKGGDLSDRQRRIHLLAQSCKNPIAHFDATMEETEQLKVRASDKEFTVEYQDLAEKSARKSWSVPASGSICSNGFR